MRSHKDPRHIARIISVMDLYHHFFPEKVDAEKLDLEQFELGSYSEKLKEMITSGVKKHAEEIDKLIDLYSTPVKSADLDSLILQIIRIGILEGFIEKNVPPKVAVDEAIELTRDFGQELATRKVSGILGKIFDNIIKKDEEAKTSEK